MTDSKPDHDFAEVDDDRIGLDDINVHEVAGNDAPEAQEVDGVTTINDPTEYQ